MSRTQYIWDIQTRCIWDILSKTLIYPYVHIHRNTHTHRTHTHWRLGILAKTPGASDAMLLFLRSSATAAVAQDPTEDSCKASSSEKVQPPNVAIGASPVELLTKRNLCIELMWHANSQKTNVHIRTYTALAHVV